MLLKQRGELAVYHVLRLVVELRAAELVRREQVDQQQLFQQVPVSMTSCLQQLSF